MRAIVPALLIGMISPALTAAPPEQIEFFEKQVRPVLAEHCYSCHGPEKQKAELRLDSREALLKGSDIGPVVVPGKPEEGSFIKSIRHEGDSKMPEKEDKLPDEKIAALTEWVRMGLPWPENDGPKLSSQEEAAQNHWAFQKVKKPAVPTVQTAAERVQSPIDSFVLAKLEPQGLSLAKAVDKRSLLRRATFDLTGLPPTMQEIEAFEADSAPDAFARVIDRLLASPRYGERWGRYWLDVARYADSKGYVFQEERRYPYAYTYRDWVIRALNEDLPYDKFLLHQLAADQLVTPEDPEPLAAMGFLTLGRRFLNNQHDIIDDRIDVVTRGLMGLTVACARCHDHKFDPISAKDYYSLYGVFASSTEPKDAPVLPGQRDPQVEAEYQKELAKRQARVEALLVKKQAKRAVLLAAVTNIPGVIPTDILERYLDRKERDEVRDRRRKIDELNAGPLAPPRPMMMADKPDLVNPRVFLRGNPGRPGEETPRRFLTVLSEGEPKPFQKGSGRLEMAQAIASADNPLTARVAVNRVWMLHFGAGLVRTPGDFGVKGEAPTHPELLDWLAATFVEKGWSLKQLHREIMLSSTYQQSSDVADEVVQKDPENRLLTRMNRRRLDFEAMRDSLLLVAGQLDPKMGGHAEQLTEPPYSKRRAVYGFIDRQNLPGTFRTFDFASPDTTSPQRYSTTVPQQALFMLN
ncbi:MAG: PSD1 and planctomycete cytochrome C domain-containing protein, partial [Chthoniobacteraceae bacterium]